MTRARCDRGLAAGARGRGEPLDRLGEERVAGGGRVLLGQTGEAHHRRLGLGSEHRQRHQAEAVALGERRQLVHEAPAVGAAGVDEHDDITLASTQVQCPQGGGVEAQALQVDALGEPGGLVQGLEPGPVPQVPGGTGEDVAAVGGDEEHPLPRLDHLHPRHGEALHAADAAQQLADAAGLRGARSRGVGLRREGRSAGQEGEDARRSGMSW